MEIFYVIVLCVGKYGMICLLFRQNEFYIWIGTEFLFLGEGKKEGERVTGKINYRL